MIFKNLPILVNFYELPILTFPINGIILICTFLLLHKEMSNNLEDSHNFSELTLPKQRVVLHYNIGKRSMEVHKINEF